MIHIDTNLISEIAQDKTKTNNFYRFINTNEIDVLLSPISLIESMNSADRARNAERISFLSKIPRKIRTMNYPFVVFDAEIVEWYAFDRRLSKERFRELFTEKLDRDSWPVFRRLIQKDLPAIQGSMPEYVHGWFFAKNISQSGKSNAMKRKVGEFMDPALATAAVASSYSQRLRENYLKGVKLSTRYETGYREHTDRSILEVESFQLRDFQIEVNQNIADFKLSKDEIFNMSCETYLEYNFYLTHLRFIADKRVKLGFRDRFYEKMARVSLTEFQGYSLFFNVAEHIKRSGDPAKQGDNFDLINLFLAPYVDDFVCDKNMKENARQEIASNRMSIDFSGFYTKTEYLRKFSI